MNISREYEGLKKKKSMKNIFSLCYVRENSLPKEKNPRETCMSYQSSQMKHSVFHYISFFQTHIPTHPSFSVIKKFHITIRVIGLSGKIFALCGSFSKTIFQLVNNKKINFPPSSSSQMMLINCSSCLLT